MTLITPTMMSMKAANMTRPAPLTCCSFLAQPLRRPYAPRRLSRDSHHAWRCSREPAPRFRRGEHMWADGASVLIRVVLAEDSYIVREGLEKVLGNAPGLEVVATCGDLDSLLAAVESERPDVVVTDIRMPPTKTDEGIHA